MRLQLVILAIVAFAIALAFRVVNAPLAFDHGRAVISPIDELYHLKRITDSATHFPHVLERDPDRGIGGAFCPWPPLYDFAFGGLARLLGATSRDDVLRRVVWFPPLFASLFVAMTAVWLARRFGMWTAVAAALALATSPFIVALSAIGSIDHHWTEPFFVIAMLVILSRETGEGSRTNGVLLGVTIAAAMFVQTALLVAAALAFLVLFLMTDGVAGMIAFSIAAAAVALYRVTRAAGYPDSQWFLGWTHAALFAGAAVACGILAWRTRGSRARVETRRTSEDDRHSAAGTQHCAPEESVRVILKPRRRRRISKYENVHLEILRFAQDDGSGHSLPGNCTQHFWALLAGAAVVLAVPSAPGALLGGSHFFGGDPWLSTIVEFQPLWRSRGASLVSIAFGLGAGAILVWFLAVQAIRRRDRARIAIALFTIVYLILTITSRRFWSVSMPLLAIAGAIYATTIAVGARRKDRHSSDRVQGRDDEASERTSVVPPNPPGPSHPLGMTAGVLALAAIALIPLTQFVLWHIDPSPPVNADQQRWIDAARFLHGQPPGRVLASWTYGHIIDVYGERPVVTDNFGTMPDETTFLLAHDALLAKRESTIADYCRRNGIRFVMLENPAGGLRSAAAIVGVDPDLYAVAGKVTPLARSTWWWRAYAAHAATRFRLIHDQPQIWELRDDVR